MKNLVIALICLISITSIAQETLEPTKELAKLNVIVVGDNGTHSKGGDIITFKGKKSGKSFTKTTAADGKFSILLPKAETYTVSYKGFDSDKEYTELEIPNVDALINFDFTIQYEPPKMYVLEGVFFDVNKATLKPVSFKALNELLAVLKAKPKMKIEIQGHTDSDGSDESNLTLSENRAESVKQYLVSKGISSDRLSSSGYGEKKPIAPNDTPENKAKNRRTEVHILEQ